MKKQRIRISDVAKLAGVSPTTVSVVVNDRVGDRVRVSPETEERVWKAVKELGYIASPIARKLAGADNQMLGIFTYEPIFPFKSRNFYYPFLVGIEEEAETQGFDLLLFTSSGHETGIRSVYKNGINRLQLADGAIFLGLSENKEELMKLSAEGFPFVFIGRRELPRGKMSYIAADYTKATFDLVQYLISLGHRKMVYLDSLEGAEVHVDRQKGFYSGLRQAGITQTLNHELLVPWNSISPENLQKWLSTGITVFLAENSEVALELMAVAEGINKTVPEDFSIAVLGDPLTFNEDDPCWTMFEIPRREMGRQAVRLLIALLNNETDEPLQEMIECTFVPGATVTKLLE